MLLCVLLYLIKLSVLIQVCCCAPRLIKNKKLLEALLGVLLYLIMQLAETLPASVTADQEAENLQVGGVVLCC